MQPNVIKSAMLNGLIMGVLFSLNFLLSISKITVLVLLSYIVISFIVVGIYRMSIRFRDKDCEGFITYGRAFSYILLTFFFAALISSVVKYFYFQFINPGYLEIMLQESLKLMEKMKFPMDEDQIAQMETVMKPASFALQYIWVNVFAGTIVGLIMAAFVKKEKNIFTESESEK